MPNFFYNALNQQSQSLNGVIQADSLKQAKQKLVDLKLNILSITPIEERNFSSTKIIKYRFQATNKEGQLITGTIASSSIFNAFQKLIQEYKYNVLKLSNIAASDTEFNSSTSIVDQLYAKHQALTLEQASSTSAQEYYKQKKKEKFQQIIERTINFINLLHTTYNNILSIEDSSFLQKYSNNLSSIKNNNNIKNTADTALKVLEQIQATTIFINFKIPQKEQLKIQIHTLQLRDYIKYLTSNNPITNTIVTLSPKTGLQHLLHKTSFSISSKHYIKLILSTPLTQIRKLSFQALLEHLFQQKNINKIGFNTYKFKYTEKSLLYISSFLLTIFLSFYFIATFVSQKIHKISIPTIFHVYNTKILVYVIVGVLLLHSTLKLKELFVKYELAVHRIIYPLFATLYILIIFNL